MSLAPQMAMVDLLLAAKYDRIVWPCRWQFEFTCIRGLFVFLHLNVRFMAKTYLNTYACSTCLKFWTDYIRQLFTKMQLFTYYYKKMLLLFVEISLFTDIPYSTKPTMNNHPYMIIFHSTISSSYYLPTYSNKTYPTNKLVLVVTMTYLIGMHTSLLLPA